MVQVVAWPTATFCAIFWYCPLFDWWGVIAVNLNLCHLWYRIWMACSWVTCFCLLLLLCVVCQSYARSCHLKIVRLKVLWYFQSIKWPQIVYSFKWITFGWLFVRTCWSCFVGIIFSSCLKPSLSHFNARLLNFKRALFFIIFIIIIKLWFDFQALPSSCLRLIHG